MDKSILVGGRAGQGTAVTSHFLGRIFCNLGYYVFNYRDYPSLIEGGHNFNVLRIADRPIFSHQEKYDFILALDQKTVNNHQKDLKNNGFILGNKNLKSEKKIYLLDTEAILEKLKAPPIAENNILMGWLFKYLGIEKEVPFFQADKEFKSKTEIVKKSMEEGYLLAQNQEKLEKIGKEKYFISASTAMGIGALEGGLDVYIAYPMTPATGLLHFLAKNQVKNNVLVWQLDDEISVANAALGASFGGARTMVGTSGGGFALMTEALSLAGMAELPLVVYLSQRPAPATGVPTYTAQADLKFALNAGHGEFPKIVVAPGDPQEAILRTQEALYLAAKYRTLAIILGDKHLAESDYSFDQLIKSDISNQKFILEKPPQNYKSYQITESGFSPRAVPGEGPFVRATSYEHNEEGYTVEDAESIVKMTNKRLRKMESIEKEVKELNPATIYGRGKNLIVGWGSTKGAIVDALPDLQDFRFLQISYLRPFPKEIVKKEIEKSKKVVLVENNATGLLGQVIAEETGCLIKNKVLKYDGRPFFSRELVEKI